MTPSLRTHLPRLAAGAMLVVWSVLSWPELRAPFTDRWSALALAVAVVVTALALVVAPVGRALHAALTRPPDGWFVAAVAAVSAGVTAWVHRVPMASQVVSGDACMYVAQARALAHFELGIPVTAPRLAHAAKFLMEGVDGRLHGVFVPGYPLFLAPFVRWDAYLLAGLVTSALLTVAHAALARAVLRDAFTWRLSVLLLAPSFARAIETADLLSHAFTGSLSALALVAALRLREDGASLRAAAALGLCGGWVFGARMLDGFVLAAVVAAALLPPLVRRALSPRTVAVALVCALPFVGLVAAQQHAATGSFRRPTVVEYADRSDWPPRCLHLGFGWEVGCKVEHGAERDSFGPDGYTPDDALRVVRERTGTHGAEVFGAALLAVAGFVALVAAPTTELLLTALFPVLLTVAYALFYYGNSLTHGARHVFPAAPFTATLVAWAVARASTWRGARWPEAVRLGAALAGVAALSGMLHAPRWRYGVPNTLGYQSIRGLRIDLRKLLEEQRITRGIVIFPDVHSYLVALDPWRDGPDLVIVHDDQTGEQDLRRHRPDLPVYLVLRDRRLLPVRSAPPGPGLQLEFERAWPSFQRPEGLAAMIIHSDECCGIRASGNRVLAVFESRPGATLDVPFDVAAAGTYRLRFDGIAGPDQGRYELSIDGAPFGTWEGFAREARHVTGPWSEPRALSAGPHTFTARCVGRHADSTGYNGGFDALVARPADAP